MTKAINRKQCKNRTMFFFLSGELLTERCRTDDLMPSIPALSFAFLQAVWTAQFWDWTSSSITLSQVNFGRPRGLCQSGGGRNEAGMTRWWSCYGADRAMCPKNLNRNDLTYPETAKQPVMLLTDNVDELKSWLRLLNMAGTPFIL